MTCLRCGVNVYARFVANFFSVLAMGATTGGPDGPPKFSRSFLMNSVIM